jgi:hypothetical protein
MFKDSGIPKARQPAAAFASSATRLGRVALRLGQPGAGQPGPGCGGRGGARTASGTKRNVCLRQ